MVKLLNPQNINLEGQRFLKIKCSRQDKNLQNPSSKIFTLENFWLYSTAYQGRQEGRGQLERFAVGPTLWSSLA